MRKYLAMLVTFAMVTVASAAAAPTRALTKALLDKALKDYPAMMSELNALGADLENELGLDEEAGQTFDMAAIKAAIRSVYANAKVKAVMTKYGWTENYFEVYLALVFGYSYLVFEEAYAAYPMPEMKAYLDQIKGLVHEDDIALVKANRVRIEEVLDLGD